MLIPIKLNSNIFRLATFDTVIIANYGNVHLGLGFGSLMLGSVTVCHVLKKVYTY